MRNTQEELEELQAQLENREMAGRNRDRELEKQLAALNVEAERGRELEQQNLQLQKTIQQLRQDCEDASKARGVGPGLRRCRRRGRYPQAADCLCSACMLYWTCPGKCKALASALSHGSESLGCLW